MQRVKITTGRIQAAIAGADVRTATPGHMAFDTETDRLLGHHSTGSIAGASFAQHVLGNSPAPNQYHATYGYFDYTLPFGETLGAAPLMFALSDWSGASPSAGQIASVNYGASYLNGVTAYSTQFVQMQLGVRPGVSSAYFYVPYVGLPSGSTLAFPVVWHRFLIGVG